MSLIIVNSAAGQIGEDAIVRDSESVLNEIMAIPAKGIPTGMLKDAHAVAIVPGVIKGSFVVGARRGKGVLLVRDERGYWHAPIFITLTGGNIGWQVGVQSTDVILVFKTKKSVQGVLSGKLTIGADASVAAGPVGRKAAAATDERLKAQILSYSRSRGLFAGVSIDGSVLKVDQLSNAKYYRAVQQGGQVIVPPSAQKLANQLLQYTGKQAVTTTQTPRVRPAAARRQTILAEQHSQNEADHVRDQLARLAPELYESLDQNWQRYLALPAEIFQGNGHPSRAAVQQCLNRFEVVRSDSRYASLANHAEFQSTYGLLKHYDQELSNSKPKLKLPAPPLSPVNRR
jgi:lipid-binding SYLF domain-containing protein